MTLGAGKDIVLVVDDSPDALSLINDALENAGMDVLVALEGAQAITIASRIRPDIILMDALMPNMDGFEACRLLKANPTLHSIPVIFMTGLTDTQDVVKGLEAGGVDYLTKPINTDELLARMKVHLQNSRHAVTLQAALDSNRQHLFTVDSSGKMRWATPQTHALIARAEVDQTWLDEQLPQQIQTWLNQGAFKEGALKEGALKEGSQLTLFGTPYPLDVEYIDKNEHNEYMLRLIDGNRPKDAALLKIKLDVTGRESEVLYWIANGKTNREIAEILEMSPRTVNKHLEQLFPKLGVENRTAAAGVALRVLAKQH